MKTVELKLSDIDKNIQQFIETGEIVVFPSNDIKEALCSLKRGWQRHPVFTKIYRENPVKDILTLINREKKYRENIKLNHPEPIPQIPIYFYGQLRVNYIRYSKLKDKDERDYIDKLKLLFYLETCLSIEFDETINSYVPVFEGIMNAIKGDNLVEAIRNIDIYNASHVIKLDVLDNKHDSNQKQNGYSYIVGFSPKEKRYIENYFRFYYAKREINVAPYVYIPDLDREVYVIEKDTGMRNN